MEEPKEFNYQEAMQELKAEIQREKDSFLYRIYRKLYRAIWNGFYLGDLKRDIRAFIQRGRRGWSNSDIWGFSDYLSKILKEGLLHLKDHHCGYPGNMTEGEWIDILNKMIDSFQLANEICNGDVIYIATKVPSFDKEYLRAIELTKGEDPVVRKVLNYKEAVEFEEGMKLFVEHFFSLWD